jgi:hypothetical protein
MRYVRQAQALPGAVIIPKCAPDPSEYLILRVTRIHHANQRKPWRLRLKRLMMHRVVVAACPGAAPFHDPEGFGTAGNTRSFVIMVEAYFRSGVR